MSDYRYEDDYQRHQGTQPFYHDVPEGDAIDSPYLHLFDEESEFDAEDVALGLAVGRDKWGR